MDCMKLRHAAALALVGAVALVADPRVVHAQHVGTTVTESEALEIVRIVAKHDSAQETPYTIDKTYDSELVPCCFQFVAVDASPESQTASPLCAVVISKRTADVWDETAEKRYDFPELRLVQTKLRMRHHITEYCDREIEKLFGWRK